MAQAAGPAPEEVTRGRARTPKVRKLNRRQFIAALAALGIGAEVGTNLMRAAAVTGPAPADSLFHEAARRKYDAALCMYHDQALIPLKTVDFENGVNVTLGLPIVRTSVDHGTALELAGTGRADPGSLREAIQLAIELASAA